MYILKKFILILFFSVLTLLIQGEILKPLLPIAFVPNIFFIGVIFFSFYEINIWGLLLTFLLGLILDVSSGEFLGPWSASFVIIYTVLTMCSGRIFIDTITSLLIISVISSVVCDLIYIALICTFLPHIENIGFYILLGSFSTALCSPIIIAILKKYYPIKKER